MDIRHDCFQPRLDTRNADRLSLFRPILITGNDKAGLCLARDLSPKGLKARTYLDLDLDERVRVHFSTESVVSGWVEWRDDKMLGVHFEEAVNMREVMTHFSAVPRPGQANRSPRLPIRCRAALSLAGRTAMVEVQDISQRGVKIQASLLQPGEEVELQLDGLERRKAVVRWIQTGIAGLTFVRALSFDELARWAAQQEPPSLLTLRSGQP